MKKTRFLGILAALQALSVFFASPTFAQNKRPVVTEINAQKVSSNKIALYWNLPDSTDGVSITALIVYRDSMPITDAKQLSDLTPIATLPKNSVSYTDTVDYMRDYYYAVVAVVTQKKDEGEELYYDEELDAPSTDEEGKTYALIIPGGNATVY